MLLVSKICAAILLAILRLFAGLIPLKVYRKLDKWAGKQGDVAAGDDPDSIAAHEQQKRRRKRIDLFLTVFLCFGAGLLLSTCFIHMIPEVRESFVSAAKKGNWPMLEQFPFAEGITCLGFFAVYLFEELGERLMSHRPTKGSKRNKKNKNKMSTATTATAPAMTSDEEDGPKQHNHISNGQHQTSLSMERQPTRSRSSSETSNLDDEDEEQAHHHTHQHHGHSHGPPPLGDLAKQKSLTAAIRGFLLVMALSFHSIFEGMAIGLQSTVNDVWFLFAAVTVHELAIMFCIGLEMLASSIKVAIYLAYMITLGLITPLGVAIGIFVTEYITDPSPGHLLAIAILQGVAAGTLLYVTFMEVLERERNKPGNGLIKFSAVFLGFILLSMMEAWGHGNGEDHHGVTNPSAADHLLDHSHDHPHQFDVVFQNQRPEVTTSQYSFYNPHHI